MSESLRGRISPNKGVPLQKETKEKISERLKKFYKQGGQSWNKNTKGVMKPNVTSFKKGHKTWNVGTIGAQVGWSKGLKLPQITREKHPNWKGGKSAAYSRPYKIAYKARKRGALGFFTSSEWKNLKEFYHFTCLSCLRIEPEIKLVVEHVIPLSLGGPNDIGNIQPLCQSCNAKKNIKTTDYRISFQNSI